MKYGKMYKTNIWYWDSELQCNVTIIEGLTVLCDANRTELEKHIFRKLVVPRKVYSSDEEFLTIRSTTGEYLTRIIMGLEIGDPRIVYRRDISGDDNMVYDARYKNLVIYEDGKPESGKVHRPRQVVSKRKSV